MVHVQEIKKLEIRQNMLNTFPLLLRIIHRQLISSLSVTSLHHRVYITITLSIKINLTVKQLQFINPQILIRRQFGSIKLLDRLQFHCPSIERATAQAQNYSFPFRHDPRRFLYNSPTNPPFLSLLSFHLPRQQPWARREVYSQNIIAIRLASHFSGQQLQQFATPYQIKSMNMIHDLQREQTGRNTFPFLLTVKATG